MTTRSPIAFPLIMFSLLAAACGRMAGAGGADGGISHPTGSGDLVLRWELVGGFVAPEALLSRVPAFSLYGDGTLITEGPQIEIYPGPALPNLQVRTVSEEGIQAILAAARDAGLTRGDARYPYPCIADAPDIRLTVVAGGRTSVVSATGLGVGESACPNADLRARARLAAFWAKLGELDRWLPDGSIGPERPYTPRAFRVYVRPYAAPSEPGLDQSPVRWPAGPLGASGEPVDLVRGVRCSVIDGQQTADVLAAARAANQLTPWVSSGRDFSVVFRPLLPDESGC